MSEFRVGGLLFTSKFDSGNLARVERVIRDNEDGSGNANEPRPDYEFNVWTTPDCAGTPFENGNRSWFYFGIRGGNPGRLIKINIMNMNKQGKLYSQGHSPIVKTMPGAPKWVRIRDRPTWETVDCQFILSFTHRFADFKGAMTYFAFCYPWSYLETQEQLSDLDKKFEHCNKLTSKCSPETIYYHRELLCHSLDHHRIDLITLSSCHGITDEEVPRFDSKLFTDYDNPRCKNFKNKRVFVLSSRVHPGETPASHVFNGFLEFILKDKDPRAAQLRKQYVFKMIPILNPDGVARGHYRTDTCGVNLNRVYLDPDFELYPSIYASKSVLVYHHVNSSVSKTNNPQSLCVNFPKGANATSSIQNVDSGDNENSMPSCQSSANKPEHSDRNVTYNFIHEDPCNAVGDAHSAKVGQLQVDVRLQREMLEGISTSEEGSSTSTSAKSQNKITSHEYESRLYSLKKDFEDFQLFGASVPVEDCDHSEQQNDSSVTSQSNVMSHSEQVVVYDDDDDVLGEDTEHLGNEGSEDEDGNMAVEAGGAPKAQHLADPKLTEIPPHESGIAFYVDLHGHASKRGCFIYGNYFADEDRQVENMLFPKLISINTAHFDFTGCNFTERNMYSKDKRDGMSKEGSGRVAIYKAIGITHSYTLECNYNTGRMVNAVPPAHGDDGRSTPPPLAGFPPKYTQAHYEEVGKALAIAALDITDTNPWSRLTLSEYNSIHGVQDWVRRYLRSLRGAPRLPRSMNRVAAKTSSMVATASSNSTTSTRQSWSRFNTNNSNTDSTTTTTNTSRTTTTWKKPVHTVRKDTQSREVLKPVFDRNRPRYPHSSNSQQASTTSVVTAAPINVTFTSTVVTTSSPMATVTMTTSIPETQIHLVGQRRKSSNSGDEAISPTHKFGQDKSNHTDIMFQRRRLSQQQTLRERELQVSRSHGRGNLVVKTEVSMQPSNTTDFIKQNKFMNRQFRPQMFVHQQREQSLVATIMRRTSGGDLVHNDIHVDRPPSNESTTLSVEEEKVQQLKNISDKLPVHHKPPGHLNSGKPMEYPMSDPPRRKIKNKVTKRRSNSYSPKSAKGQRKISNGTDSESERKRLARRKGTAKMRNESLEEVDDVDRTSELLNTDVASGIISGSAVQLSPRPSTSFRDRVDHSSDNDKVIKDGEHSTTGNNVEGTVDCIDVSSTMQHATDDTERANSSTFWVDLSAA